MITPREQDGVREIKIMLATARKRLEGIARNADGRAKDEDDNNELDALKEAVTKLEDIEALLDNVLEGV